jgi:Mg/Co/Ni transporter MgtE
VPGDDPPTNGAPRTPVAVSPVGKRAARDFWAARSGDTCAQALQRLRELHPKAPNAPLQVCYVVDEGQRLLGCAPVVAVVAAAADKPITDLMNPRTIPIPEGAPEEAIQDFFITYGLTSFPVVDREGRLCGVVGVEHFGDLVFEGFEGQLREECCRSVGLPPTEREHGTFAAAGARFLWLAVTLAGGFLAALVLARGQLAPDRLALMAFFLPVCVALAERVAQRTLTLRTTWSEERPALARREALASALLALGVAAIAGGLGFLWHGRLAPALTLGGACGAIVVVATAVGLLFPVGEKGGARVTPAVIPIALAVADVAGVAIYLVLVRALMGAGL